MFAFALWDAAAPAAARPRPGRQEAAVLRRPRRRRSGSPPRRRSILQDPEIPRDVDLDAIDAFLHFQYVPHPLSAFAAVRKLPPAHARPGEDGKVEIERYWRLAYEPTTGRRRPRRRRCTSGSARSSSRRPGCGCAERRAARRVPVRRGRLERGRRRDGEADRRAGEDVLDRLRRRGVRRDRRYARQVAELFGTDHHEFVVEPHAMEILPRLVWHYGEPFADSVRDPELLPRRADAPARHGGAQRRRRRRELRRLPRATSPTASPTGSLGLPRGCGSRRAGWRTAMGRRTRAIELPRAAARPRARCRSMSRYARYAMWMSYFNERRARELYTPEFRQSPTRRSDARRTVIRDGVAPPTRPTSRPDPRRRRRHLSRR